MATFNPTPSQQRAIDDRGKNILVSASAGSGKTAVLVERAIKLIREGIHVDRMLTWRWVKCCHYSLVPPSFFALSKSSFAFRN